MQKGEDAITGAGKVRFREHIEQVGCNYYIGIACGFWYEFSIGGGPNRFGFDFEERSVITMDDGSTRISTSTMPMVGRAVATLLSLKISPGHDHGRKGASLEDFKNKAVYVSSFTVSQRDMLESVLRVTATKLEDWKITRTRPKIAGSLARKCSRTATWPGL